MEQRATAIVLASCLCFLLLPSICLGTTWYVPSATCPTIQSAVNLAGATDDIILTATNYGGAGNIDVDYLGGGSGLMYGYTVKFTWDGSFVTAVPGDVTQGTLLNSVGSTFWVELPLASAEPALV